MTRTHPFVDRRNLALGLLLIASPAIAQAPPCAPPRVLFVCPAGTVKSAIAREHLKRRARERGVAVSASSRGVHPEEHVSPALASRLAADGVDPRAEPILALAANDISQADIVVAFDDAVRAPGLEHARAWDIPSWNSGYDHAKAAMVPRIEALLDELAARPCRP